MEIFVRPDGERGVRAAVPLEAGQFVCEYESNFLATKKEVEAAEAEYDVSTLYVIEVTQTNHFFTGLIYVNVHVI